MVTSAPMNKDACLSAAKKFRALYAIEASDENVIATIHLMNTHGLDRNAALDQSSRSGNDHGVDAWYYDSTAQELTIYQSKLTDSKPLALRGLSDLNEARQWLEGVLIDGAVEAVPSDNHCLFGLYTHLSGLRPTLKRIRFVLLSTFSSSDLEDSHDYQSFESQLTKSALNAFVRGTPGGALRAEASQYNLINSIPQQIRAYAISKIPNARVKLRKNAHLDLAYVSLYSLVQLYRQRGEVLFDKNVRLSLMGTKESRERLLNPMEHTLDEIVTGSISPQIFPFYHLGVTIAASSSAEEDVDSLRLEAPSIINGCQTITIANEYLKRLEKQKKTLELERFKEIQVIAKIVVGTSGVEVKEITNCNNRQNPIENWQLFSNEPVHIEIEATLKDQGVFYERQKGKFDATLRSTDRAQHYYATNGTYIRVVELGQLIALSHGYFQWAAKPSEIFLNEQNHDKIFDRSISAYPQDAIFTFNLFKALKRALNNYLERPTHDDVYSSKIFSKPIVRAHIYYLALRYAYQNVARWNTWPDFALSLNKKASPILVDKFEGLYQRIVAKTKSWYVEKSRELKEDVSNRAMDSFFGTMATELGIDADEGPRPFSTSSLEVEATDRPRVSLSVRPAGSEVSA